MMNDDRELAETAKTERRITDTIFKWAAIVGPIFGVAFGFGVAKATFTGKITNLTEKLSDVTGRVLVLEKVSSESNGSFGVELAKVKEQVTFLSRGMERIENLVQQTFYRVSVKDPKAK